MNAPHPRRDDQAEARRLVDALQLEVDGLARMIEMEANDVAIDEMTRLHDDLRDAAALLDSYQAGVVLATPHPITDCYLVQRYRADEMSPPVDEIVLLWVASDMDRGRPWLGHIDEDGRWWYVDSGIAHRVIYWALRPGSTAC